VVERYALTLFQVHRMVDQGRVQSRQRGRELQVELTSLEAALRKREIPTGFVTAADAAQRLGVSSGHVLWLIHHGRLRAQRQGRKWIVAAGSVEERALPPSHVSTKEAAQRSGRSPRTIRRWIRQERLLTARKVHGRWQIAVAALAAAVPCSGPARGGIYFVAAEVPPARTTATG
jgi:excisionase family DNA binding protein